MKNNIVEGKCCGDCSKCTLDVDMIPCAITMALRNTVELRKEIAQLKSQVQPQSTVKPKIISDYEYKENEDPGCGTDSEAGTDSV